MTDCKISDENNEGEPKGIELLQTDQIMCKGHHVCTSFHENPDIPEELVSNLRNLAVEINQMVKVAVSVSEDGSAMTFDSESLGQVHTVNGSMRID